MAESLEELIENNELKVEISTELLKLELKVEDVDSEELDVDDSKLLVMVVAEIASESGLEMEREEYVLKDDTLEIPGEK